jgi:hypothetical protein
MFFKKTNERREIKIYIYREREERNIILESESEKYFRKNEER